MLKVIGAKGLKGLNFEQSLGQKTIIIGPNGSGKTALLTAISLLSIGYQPGVNKKQIDILNNLASEDKLQVYGQFENIHLYRRYSRTKIGAKQEYMVDRKKAKKDDFVVALSKTPKVIDLSEFNDLSDDKKFDYLVNLYGETDELNSLDLELSELKEKKNLVAEKLAKQEATVENLVKAQADLELPAGTLAEIQQEIEKVWAECRLTNKNLATAKAQQELKEKEKTKVEPSPEIKQDTVLSHPATNHSHSPSPFISDRVTGVKNVDEFGDPVPPPKTQPHWVQTQSSITSDPNKEKSPAVEIAKEDQTIINTAAATSIQKILGAMAKGCNLTCAAKIVARMELRKYVREDLDRKEVV